VTARLCAATSERKTQSLLCWNCGRTLLEYQSPVGLVSIRCRRCGCQNVLTTDDVESLHITTTRPARPSE
jgi:DNA-directed RNA polymerase subunit RPC12/RpoP